MAHSKLNGSRACSRCCCDAQCVIGNLSVRGTGALAEFPENSAETQLSSIAARRLDDAVDIVADADGPKSKCALCTALWNSQPARRHKVSFDLLHAVVAHVRNNDNSSPSIATP